MTAPSRDRRSGRGIWNAALPAIGLGVGGLVVAAAVLWHQVVERANTSHQAAMVASAADGYAGWFNARISSLRAQMRAVAEAEETVATLASYDEARMRAAGAELTALLAFADRVEIVPKGAAAVDLNAEVPISWAAREVIQRAENEPFVGPEGVVLDSRRGRFYAAQPILQAGAVAGVLFAAWSTDYFLEPLTAFHSGAGRVSLQQAFDGAEPVTLLQWGDAPASGTSHVSRELAVPYWRIVFEPGDAVAQPVASAADVATALAVALGLLLAGVLFAFSSLSRALKADADALLAQLSQALRGGRRQPQRYTLALFADLGRDTARMARAQEEPAAGARAAQGEAPRPAGSAGPLRQDEDDVLQDEVTNMSDEHEGANQSKSFRPAPAEPDDFLEVRASGASRDNFGIEVSEDTSPLAMGLELEPEIFRSYDIRGITTRNLTEDVVYWIGRAFAAEAAEHQQSRVAVGRDGRHSSAPLRDALTRGLADGGMHVLDIGQVPTPVLYFATHALDTGTGIMITGSHNPPEYNGLKMVLAGVTLAEERIQALRARIEENRLSEGDGRVEEVDVAEQYVQRIVDDVVVAQPLKVVVDCGNGVAGRLVPELVSRLGCDVVPLYCDVDGDFPNHHPDPAEPANLEDLITVVAAEQADLGLAFDGDGDRLGVVTRNGEIVWPDKLLMLYAQDIVGRNPGADIIYDVKCSRHLNSLISDLGGRPIMWKTGHSHIKAKLKETGALLAGEFSGHICFGERWYGFDDALYSAARLLEILGGSAETLDEMVAQFPVTYSTPEIKIQTTEQAKFEIIQRLSIDGDFGTGTITTIDGLRVDFPDGWGLVRPSNTSPVLSLRFEADTQEALDRIKALFQKQLSAIDPALRFN